MGRNSKKIEKKDIKSEIFKKDSVVLEPDENMEDTLKKNDEILSHNQEINRLNSEKSNRDMVFKTIHDLKKHEKELREILQNLSLEADLKTKIVQHLENEIKSLNFTLEKSKSDFDKTNAERLKLLAEKETRIESADLEYRKVIGEVSEKNKSLKVELQKIQDERQKHASEITALREWVETNKKNFSALEKDLENREEELKTAREEFEKERDDLKPSLARVSEIKNENLNLSQRLESEKTAFEDQKASMESYRKSIESEKDSLKAQLEKERKELSAHHAKLKQWEQNLNDQMLELKAREAEAQRMMKRYQLTKSAEEPVKA